MMTKNLTSADLIIWSGCVILLMSLQELVGVQIFRRSSKSPFLVHPTLPFNHLHPVYPPTPASCHTQSVQGGVHREQRLGDDTGSPFQLLVLQVNFKIITIGSPLIPLCPLFFCVHSALRLVLKREIRP